MLIVLPQETTHIVAMSIADNALFILKRIIIVFVIYYSTNGVQFLQPSNILKILVRCNNKVSYSFISFLLAVNTRTELQDGNYMEVLSPKDVRVEMMKIIKGMGDEYAGVSREDCKKKVPGVKELKALMEDAEE